MAHCYSINTASNRNPLDLVERNLIAGAIIELGGARAFVRRHGLSILQSAAGFKIGGDAGGAEGMAADLDGNAKFGRSSLDHAPGVDAVHWRVGQRAGAANGRAEQGSLAGVAETGRLDISVEIGFEIVMRGHFMALAAFLMQPHPPALALGVVVLNTHGDDRADAREGEGHHRNHRSISQPDDGRRVDAVEQLAGLFTGQHRGFAGFDDVLRPPHRMGRIGRDDLASDQPVEQHANGGEVLLHRRLFKILAERFDIGGDMQRLDISDFTNGVMITPGEEPHDGVIVSRARVLVADRRGEEFEEAARGLLAGVGDHSRHDDRRGDGRGDFQRLGILDDGQLAGRIGHVFSVT